MALVIGPTPWQFAAQVAAAALGSSIGGGFLICKSGGVGWIVAPNTTEVSRTWYSRDDAVTTANANASCGDWFIPTYQQLQNPGFACRTYWDSYSNTYYMSNCCIIRVCLISMADGSLTPGNFGLNITHANCPHCVRAFRCVTY